MPSRAIGKHSDLLPRSLGKIYVLRDWRSSRAWRWKNCAGTKGHKETCRRGKMGSPAIACIINIRQEPETSLAQGREKGRQPDEPCRPRNIQKEAMSQRRGLPTAKGHTPKKDLAAKEVPLGQLRLDYVACPRKTRCNQWLIKRNQGKVTR